MPVATLDAPESLAEPGFQTERFVLDNELDPGLQEIYEYVVTEAYQMVHDHKKSHDFYEVLGVKRTDLKEYEGDEVHRYLDKREADQEVGAFKLRTAASAARAAIEENEDLKLLVATSTGNFARSVAYVGNVLGLDVDIYCPESISDAKREPVEALGAKVHTRPDFAASMTAGKFAGNQPDAKFLHPFDEKEAIAGNATIGFELIDDLRRLHHEGNLNVYEDEIVITVPVGGGGLISGIASVFLFAKQMGWIGKENVKIVGVQMEGCDAAKRTKPFYLAGQMPGELFGPGEFKSTCDGIAVKEAGENTMGFLSNENVVVDIVAVTEAEVGEAMKMSAKMHGITAEPAGALAIAGRNKLARSTNQPTIFISLTSGENKTMQTVGHFAHRDRVAKMVGRAPWVQRMAEGSEPGFKKVTKELEKDKYVDRKTPVLTGPC